MAFVSCYSLILLLSAVPPPLTSDAVPRDADLGCVATARDESAEATSEWTFDVLELQDGSVYRGLVQAERPAEIEFAEIFRPPGKPMFAVIRPVTPDQVAKKTLTSGEDRDRLLARFQQFRNRARIEAGRMDNVALQRAAGDAGEVWTYEGPWFQLESTADETTVRRCVVRAEQIFRAYRQLLPPTRQHRTGLRLLIFGSTDEYQRHLREYGLTFASPAWFSRPQNLVVAGGELNSFNRRLQQTQSQNKDVRGQYKMLKSAFSQRLATLIEQMQQRGYSSAQIEQEVKLRTAAWQREYDEAMSRLDLAAVQNEALFGKVTDQMFAQLYHEAFHAYVENYVCAEDGMTLPHWLNEGLAQIFETGQIEADSLRIDAPDRKRLAELQNDLRGEQPLTVQAVLLADEQSFLNPSSSRSAQRYYLYSWGLAYFLVFEQNRFRPDVLDAFLRNVDDFGPAARFTHLVDMPIAKFDQLWRERVLAMRPF